MELGIYVVDAFTDVQFKGNSAAVVPLEHWIDSAQMQSIAIENNLSETAFIKQTSDNHYQIRWFSPITEIDFCGHATLAASFVLFNYLGCEGEITYETLSVGELMVVQRLDGGIEMNFPKQPLQSVSDIPEHLLKGLSITPQQVLKNNQAYVAVLASEQEVKEVSYDSEQLKRLAPFDVAVTALSNEYDFVSRYFWPASGGDEDPVTGSMHTGLAPYWSGILNKNKLVAYQSSGRGGVVYCDVQSERVTIAGYGVLYLKGTIFI
ncbi:PhzF family phenazine biosynthesis protein [Vibrio genomosp. F10]|uniref:Phenazine biosynthesis protein PhzF n=3 Tax=Vibrio genomosp. F10 TaxID=723171 RepID=A0A1E5BB95_9VIBR|nr:PhzF family phenazine biosynthesis protein [Vibrio genomosp. F10]OEE31348.1 phenazine biosynthesis protein PhzF [Vibrio genomosp. F10 str. ZF-129]OEF10602.1 phenazine biosynthesis protein PhzF [Vibrio genomosp. F10 str. 9ZB36]